MDGKARWPIGISRLSSAPSMLFDWLICLLIKRAGACLAFWISIPVMLALITLPIPLTDPQLGWRIQEHSTAAALDGLILATRRSVAMAGVEYAISPPSPPPLAPPPFSPEVAPPPSESLRAWPPQSVKWGKITLIAKPLDGTSILTNVHMKELQRLENVAVAWLGGHGLCWRGVDGQCKPSESITSFWPTQAEVNACAGNVSQIPGFSLYGEHGGALDFIRGASAVVAHKAAVKECRTERFQYRSQHHEGTAPRPNCTTDFWLAGEDCEWTRQWSCPGQQVGKRGTAFDDGHIGYHCCCEEPPPIDASYAHYPNSAKQPAVISTIRSNKAEDQLNLWAGLIEVGVLDHRDTREELSRLSANVREPSRLLPEDELSLTLIHNLKDEVADPSRRQPSNVLNVTGLLLLRYAEQSHTLQMAASLLTTDKLDTILQVSPPFADAPRAKPAAPMPPPPSARHALAPSCPRASPPPRVPLIRSSSSIRWSTTRRCSTRSTARPPGTRRRALAARAPRKGPTEAPRPTRTTMASSRSPSSRCATRRRTRRRC